MRLFPKHEEFYDFFVKSAQNTLEAAKFLERTVQNGPIDEAALKTLEEFEHTGDRITHETMGRLNRTFVTPIDREDIHQLASSQDDVLDFIYAASEAMSLYKVDPVPQSMKDLAGLLVQITAAVCRAVDNLSDVKHPQTILDICVEINRLENEADNTHRRALADLFENEKDAIKIIKTKEILEDLETATDKCEDVANVIEGIVLKNA
jgi:predicted phosphate transport protein (TIGR00153 family)